MTAKIPSDPISFWTGASLRLGLVLALITIAPILIDWLFLKGGGTTIAVLTLTMVGPIAALCLLAALILFLVGLTRK